MREPDARKIEPLIGELQSDDSFVRLGAIEELQELTKMTLGFRFNDPADSRSTAVERWKAWWKEQQQEKRKKQQLQTAIQLTGGMLDIGALKKAIKEIPSEKLQHYLNALILKMKTQESRCEACQTRRAAVQVTQISDGEPAVKFLCELCAHERGDILL
jgi:hypothetical protein